MIIGFLGCGKMGGALIRGLLRAGVCAPEEIFGADAAKATLDQLCAETGIKPAATPKELARAAKTLVDSGLARLGYVYVNVDDGWWLKRRTSDGRLQIRTRIFPSAAVPGGDGGVVPTEPRACDAGLS